MTSTFNTPSRSNAQVSSTTKSQTAPNYHPVTNTGHFFQFLQSRDPQAQCIWHLDNFGIIIYQFSVANRIFYVCLTVQFNLLLFPNEWALHDSQFWPYNGKKCTWDTCYISQTASLFHRPRNRWRKSCPAGLPSAHSEVGYFLKCQGGDVCWSSQFIIFWLDEADRCRLLIGFPVSIVAREGKGLRWGRGMRRNTGPSPSLST